MIRPVAEYCSVVFHPLITASDSHELERIQMQALKGIFGWRISYSELLKMSDLERLDVRREKRFSSMPEKMIESSHFSTWFPHRLYRSQADLRSREKYKVYRASSERYLDSPLNLMRKKLNEMALSESK